MKRYKCCLLMVLLTACRCCKLCAPADDPVGDIELVNHIGGVARAVVARGDTLYAGFGSELAILNIADPTAPERLGYVVLPGTVERVFVTDQYAYVYTGDPYDHTADTTGLYVIDIADPTAPFEVQGIPLPGHAVVGVAEDYAYTASWDTLKVVDVSDPSAPADAATLTTRAPIAGMAVAGSYAYVTWHVCYRAACTDGMSVLNVSDPATPRLVGTLDTTAAMGGPTAIVGEYLYVGYYGGIHILDISNPAEPALVRSWERTGANPVSIVAVDDRAYVAHSAGIVAILDVSDASNPFQVGASFTGAATSSDMAVTGEYAYVAGGDAGGLQVVDISNPYKPVPVVTYSAPGRAADLAAANGHAYLVDLDGRFWGIDVSGSNQPHLISSDLGNGYAGGGQVAIANDYAYYAIGSQDMRAVDISQPSAPRDVSRCTFPAGINAIAASGDCVYVATIEEEDAYGRTKSRATLRVMDVSNPAEPHEIGNVEIIDPEPRYAHLESMSVADNYVYATSMRGLWVIDVSDPARPIVTAQHETPGVASGIVVAGDYAYIADGFSGLRVFDVSNPRKPSDEGYYGIAAFTRDVAAGKGFVCVTNDEEGLWVFDASNPAALTHPHNFCIPGQSRLAIEGDYVYILDTVRGLFVLKLSEPPK